MKKIGLIIALVLSTVLLVACGTKTNVKIEIENLNVARTSMTFNLNVTDPDEKMKSDLITAVIYHDGKEITRTKPTLKDDVYSVTFDGLSVGYTYELVVFASIDGKNIKMAKSEGSTSTLGGSESEPKLIKTVEDFRNLKNDLTAYYRLENDLDFENASFQNAFGSQAFNGKFDGNGKTIKNIKMDALTTYTGLFGYNKGTIKNLTVENVNLSFKSSSQYVGILAGRNSGIIENVTLKDSTFKTEFSRTGEIYIGGLVGYSEPKSQIKDTNVVNLEMSVVSSGRTEPYVGLLLGRAKAANLSNVSATGNLKVDSSDTSYVGGLVGSLDNDYQVKSTLLNATSTVTLSVGVKVVITLVNNGKVDAPASVYVGGLVGASRNSDIVSATSNADITIPYLENAATVDSDSDQLIVGGLVGFSNNIVTEGLSTGSIKLGSTEEETFASFEDIYVAGLIGYQAPDRLSKGLAYDFEITINSDALVLLKVSQVIGNMVSPNATFNTNTILVNGAPHTGLTVFDYVADTVVTNQITELPLADLDDYFTSSFVRDILEALID
ncbi:MAG: hypothetical protein RBQ91_03555 [Acholeplasma sp.]|nr:hypothetical protein [Acholeplasma sp.]